jgi:zinc transport system substrate-binding protein
MPRKIFLSADELLLDSFRLARQILDSGWRPDVLVALWRGGTPVGVAVHEFLAYHGVDTCHMAIKCSSYSGIGARGDVRFEYADPALESIQPGQRVLVVDDVFDSGCTADAVIRRLDPSRVDVRLATVFWKPPANCVPRRPDFHVRTTDDWIVFPHELEGLTPDEVCRKSPALGALLKPAPPPATSAARNLLLAGIAGLALAATGMSALAQPPVTVDSQSAANTLQIVTSFYPMYVAALNVAQGITGVEVTNLTGPQTGCLHDYQMTPADRVRLAGASVLIANGAGMEAFLDKVTQQLPSLRVVDASAGLPLIRAPGAVGDNPHVWLSVSLHIGQISNIVTQLAQIDPPHAAHYRSNGAAYVAQLDRLRADLHKGLEHARTRDIITFHEAFPYFAQELNLRVIAVIEREPGSKPSAQDMARTIELIRMNHVSAIFAEPQYPAKAAAAIARETGVRLHTLDPVVTGPMRADAYVEIMKRNLVELQGALMPDDSER